MSTTAGPGLPAIAGRGDVGAPGVKPLTPDPSGPSRRDPLATVTITAQHSSRGGAGRIGTRSGLDAGGRLRTMRASLSRTPPQHSHDPVSRASRPARSRSGAGASAGRSKLRRVRAVSARLENV